MSQVDYIFSCDQCVTKIYNGKWEGEKLIISLPVSSIEKCFFRLQMHQMLYKLFRMQKMMSCVFSGLHLVNSFCFYHKNAWFKTVALFQWGLIKKSLCFNLSFKMISPCVSMSSFKTFSRNDNASCLDKRFNEVWCK